MNRFLIFLAITFLTNTIWAQNTIQAKFDKEEVKFDISITNTSKYNLKVLELELINENVQGSFYCGAKNYAVIPVADYLLRFNLSDLKTVITLDSGFTVGPQTTENFTVSVLPISLKACSRWSSDISIKVKFESGLVLQSLPQKVNSLDFDKYQTFKAKDETILKAANHYDEQLCIQGIDQLSASTLDSLTIKSILEKQIKKESDRIKKATAKQIGNFKFKGFANQLLLLINNHDDFWGYQVYCHSLGQLNVTNTIQPLCDKLVLFIPTYSFHNPAKEALNAMGNPEVPIKVRTLMKEDSVWKERLNGRYNRIEEISEILIHYQDIESVELIKSNIKECNESFIIANYLKAMVKLVEKNKTTSNAFLKSMKDFYPTLLNHESTRVRALALELCCMTSTDLSFLKQQFENGLLEGHNEVGIITIRWIGLFKLKEYATQLNNIKALPEWKDAKFVFQKTLKQLEEK